jgi:CRISPR-associated protein Cas2
MYVIIVYDIDTKRVAKVCKYLRQHLNWVQNSVFEGELTKAQLARVKSGLLGIIDDDEDSVLIYQMRHEKWMDRQVIGIEKNLVTNLL